MGTNPIENVPSIPFMIKAQAAGKTDGGIIRHYTLMGAFYPDIWGNPGNSYVAESFTTKAGQESKTYNVASTQI
jgi:hypothetical protein